MAADDFFNRWSRNKAESQTALQNASATSGAEHSPSLRVEMPQNEPVPQAMPQMADVEQLHEGSDFSVFMRDGVDESVKRSAMKKLFSNPHFNVMDGLDIYVADYSQPDPLPVGMLAGLRHAEALLNPLRQLEHPLQTLLQASVEAPEASEASELAKCDQMAISEVAATPDMITDAMIEDEAGLQKPPSDNINDKDPIQV
jgi:hypothetical protein